MAVSSWDWSFLDAECWKPTRIEVSDIDGFIERNGHFLVLEGERQRELSTAKRIAYDAMIRTGLFHVLVMWGDCSTGRIDRLLWRGPSGDKEYTADCVAAAVKLCRRWFLWATEQRRAA
jgi:hypothetical protein